MQPLLERNVELDFESMSIHDKNQMPAQKSSNIRLSKESWCKWHLIKVRNEVQSIPNPLKD